MVWVFVAILLILHGVLVKKYIELKRSLKRLEASQKRQQQELNDIFQETKALLNADIVFGKSIKQLNLQLQSLDNRQGNIEHDNKKDGSFHNAIKLLKLGESPESVMKSCNLSRAELNLLCNLNGYKTLLDASS